MNDLNLKIIMICMALVTAIVSLNTAVVYEVYQNSVVNKACYD